MQPDSTGEELITSAEDRLQQIIQKRQLDDPEVAAALEDLACLIRKHNTNRLLDAENFEARAQEIRRNISFKVPEPAPARSDSEPWRVRVEAAVQRSFSGLPVVKIARNKHRLPSGVDELTVSLAGIPVVTVISWHVYVFVAVLLLLLILPSTLIIHQIIKPHVAVKKTYLPAPLTFKGFTEGVAEPPVAPGSKTFTIVNRFTGDTIFEDRNAATLAEAIRHAVDRNVSLAKADLHNVNLCQMQIASADLTEADLRCCQLQNANLADVKLDGAALEQADFYRAVLHNVTMGGATLNSARLAAVKTSGLRMSGAHLVMSDLTKASLSGADCANCDFSFANLFEADLTGADCRDSCFKGADLTLARLHNASCTGASFVNAKMMQTRW